MKKGLRKNGCKKSRDTVPFNWRKNLLTLIGYALGFLVHLLLKTILHHDALAKYFLKNQVLVANCITNLF